MGWQKHLRPLKWCNKKFRKCLYIHSTNVDEIFLLDWTIVFRTNLGCTTNLLAQRGISTLSATRIITKRQKKRNFGLHTKLYVDNQVIYKKYTLFDTKIECHKNSICLNETTCQIVIVRGRKAFILRRWLIWWRVSSNVNEEMFNLIFIAQWSEITFLKIHRSEIMNSTYYVNWNNQIWYTYCSLSQSTTKK